MNEIMSVIAIRFPESGNVDSDRSGAVTAQLQQAGVRVARSAGRGLVAVVPSARRAIQLAVEAQQASVEADSGSGTICVGVAVQEVFDRDPQRLARSGSVADPLAAAADPGEVLVSATARDLVPDTDDLRLAAVDSGAGPDVGTVYRAFWEPAGTATGLTVVVADDAPLIRAGLVQLLESSGFRVTEEVGDADDLVAAVDRSPPDLVVTDIRMPPTNTDEGLRAAASIRREHPEVAVLVLSQYIEARSAAELLDDRAAGIGYLLKDRVSDLEDFVEACRAVAAGGSVIDPVVTQRLVQRRHSDTSLGSLTDRESEVLELMAQGRSNSSIAEDLFVSGKTVETHIRSIFQKLDIEDSPEGNRRVRAVLEWLQP